MDQKHPQSQQVTNPKSNNYPQVSQAQYDIWKDSDVTVAYLAVLEYRIEELTKSLGSGNCVVADSADLTLSNSSNILGQQVGLAFAWNLDLIVEKYDLIKKESNDD